MNVQSIDLAHGVRVQSEMVFGRTVYRVYSRGSLSFESYDGHRAMMQAVFFSEQNGKGKK